MTARVVQFFAIILAALALVPSAAHLAALPNKIGLLQAEYLVAQGIYRGWAILGTLWVAALAANGLLAVIARTQRGPFCFALMAAFCFAIMFAIFVAWTLPANQATANWTMAPQEWEILRRQWEYSHAANAVIAFLAVCFTTLSALNWRA